MAGALVEIWLTVSALSSLVIVMIAIGNSDMRREKRLRPDPFQGGAHDGRRADALGTQRAILSEQVEQPVEQAGFAFTHRHVPGTILGSAAIKRIQALFARHVGNPWRRHVTGHLIPSLVSSRWF